MKSENFSKLQFGQHRSGQMASFTYSNRAKSNFGHFWESEINQNCNLGLSVVVKMANFTPSIGLKVF